MERDNFSSVSFYIYHKHSFFCALTSHLPCSPFSVRKFARDERPIFFFIFWLLCTSRHKGWEKSLPMCCLCLYILLVCIFFFMPWKDFMNLSHERPRDDRPSAPPLFDIVDICWFRFLPFRLDDFFNNLLLIAFSILWTCLLFAFFAACVLSFLRGTGAGDSVTGSFPQIDLNCSWLIPKIFRLRSSNNLKRFSIVFLLETSLSIM